MIDAVCSFSTELPQKTVPSLFSPTKGLRRQVPLRSSVGCVHIKLNFLRWHFLSHLLVLGDTSEPLVKIPVVHELPPCCPKLQGRYDLLWIMVPRPCDIETIKHSPQIFAHRNWNVYTPESSYGVVILYDLFSQYIQIYSYPLYQTINLRQNRNCMILFHPLCYHVAWPMPFPHPKNNGSVKKTLAMRRGDRQSRWRIWSAGPFRWSPGDPTTCPSNFWRKNICNKKGNINAKTGWCSLAFYICFSVVQLKAISWLVNCSKAQGNRPLRYLAPATHPHCSSELLLRHFEHVIQVLIHLWFLWWISWQKTKTGHW